MNAMDLLTKGGSGTAIAYFALTAPTAWLGLLPEIPEGQFLPLVASGGIIVGAIIQRFFPRKETEA